PDVIKVAKDCELFGAQGITVHPRPDERHIKYADVLDLSQVLTTEFNIEGYPDQRFMELVKKTKPAQVTLVPDPPDAITSNTGWDAIKHRDLLKEIVTELKKEGVRVSLFLNPDERQVDAAKETGTDRIELYTEPYAAQYLIDKSSAIAPYRLAALRAQSLELGINAGHDLSLENLEYFFKNIPGLLEVSIGHALICDALYFGLENTIQLYLRQLKP
ncbi:MAG TPA: pyridoxine 5'-phosphate synthase, partial [Cytophagales bacterium]|nr:pyridoxine 5'-phosphate synthase [Cytophagales bacterium]